MQDEGAVVVTYGSERLEGVDVRIQAASADEVPAGGWHLGAAEASEKRPGQQERGADLLSERRIDRGRVDVGAAERELVLALPANLDAETVQDLEHRIHVANAGHVGEHELGIGQHRSSQDRQRTVLVAGGHDRSAQRRAALNDELLHRWCQRASLHRSHSVSPVDPRDRPLDSSARTYVLQSTLQDW